MARLIIKKLDVEHVLVSDERTGVAYVREILTGVIHPCHEHIPKKIKASQMKADGKWTKNDRIIYVAPFMVNIDTNLSDTKFQLLAIEHCRCQACLERRLRYVGPLLTYLDSIDTSPPCEERLRVIFNVIPGYVIREEE